MHEGFGTAGITDALAGAGAGAVEVAARVVFGAGFVVSGLDTAFRACVPGHPRAVCRGVDRDPARGPSLAQAGIELSQQPGDAVLCGRVGECSEHLPDQLGKPPEHGGMRLNPSQDPATAVARSGLVGLRSPVLDCTGCGADDGARPRQQVPGGRLLNGGVNGLGAVDDGLALLGSVDLTLGDAFDRVRQAVEGLEAGVGGIVEDAGQFGFGPRDEGFDFAHQRGAEVADHDADHGLGEVALVFLQLLAGEEQHRAQGHPCGGHGRRDGHHADQVDAQAGPVQRVAGAGSAQVNDVAQCVEQGDDVAHDRHGAGPGFDGGQVDLVGTEVQ